MNRIMAGVFGTLILVIAGLGFALKIAIEKNTEVGIALEQAASANDAWRRALDQQTAYARRLDATLAESVNEYETLRRTTDRRLRNYETHVGQNRSTGVWHRTRVPLVVAQRMCNYDHEAGGCGMPADPPAIYRAAEDSVPYTNGDLWAWTERLLELIERANHDRLALSDLGSMGGCR